MLAFKASFLLELGAAICDSFGVMVDYCYPVRVLFEATWFIMEFFEVVELLPPTADET